MPFVLTSQARVNVTKNNFNKSFEYITHILFMIKLLPPITHLFKINELQNLQANRLSQIKWKNCS